MRFLSSVTLSVLFTSAIAVSFNSTTASASDLPILDPSARFHPVFSKQGMVVSQEALASEVGAKILAEGGNAVDAAVATGFALAVTLPRAGNIGGGGFMLAYLADQNRTIALDFREMAPAAADKDLFLDAEGNVDKNKARFSIFSSGVPGTVAGLLKAHEQYGLLDRKAVLAPAIKLAKHGFDVPYALAQGLTSRKERLHKSEASKRYFYHKDGTPYAMGEHFVQKDLAKTLERISKHGAKGFYEGKTADLIVAEMKRHNGLITHQDLINYRAVEREPVCGDYHSYQVCAMPPPSSGGVHLVQMLNILEGWNLTELGHNSAAYLHRLIEVMRRAYADRSEYLGDPDFYPVPIAELTDKAYAAKLRDSIDLVSATRSDEVKPALNLPKESEETTHYSTWDKWGNVVSTTYTLNFSYGSGISVAGAGFLLNNEMDDFSSKPGVPNAFGLLGSEANAIAAGKRPLSSMTPTILYQNGEPVMATGSPGGSTIITVVLQTLLNRMTFDMNIAEATAVPRIHHQWYPDVIATENGISKDTIDRLQSMGHNFREGSVLGSTQSIERQGEYLAGAADPRRTGAAAITVEQVRE